MTLSWRTRACMMRPDLLYLKSRRSGHPTAWDASRPVCDWFLAECAHTGRCCFCCYLIVLPFVLLLVMLVISAPRIAAAW